MPDDIQIQAAETTSPVTPEVQRMSFTDAFSEDKNETLIPSVKLRIKGVDVEPGTQFPKGEKIAGVDFHLLRYLDLAVRQINEGFFEVTGFFSQK